MSGKYALVTGIVGLVTMICGLCCGLLIGHQRACRDAERATAALELAHQEKTDELWGRLEDAEVRLRKMTGEKAAAAQKQAELADEVATLTAELEKLREKSSSEKTASVKKSKLPVAFGKWAELEAIQNADWPELGEAVENINDLVVGLVESMENDEAPDPELQEKIRNENNKLVRYAAQIMGKIPTHSPVNGEFSHPITLANLMGAMLDRAELSLSDEQRSEFAQIGNDYENEYDELQKTYNGETPRLVKLIDELELKRDAVNGMQDLLTEEQHEWIVRPQIHHRLQLDTLSPFTMAIMLTKPKHAGSVDEIRQRIPNYITDKLRIDLEQTGPIDAIVDSWIRDLGPLLDPVEKPSKFIHIDQAITAGRAQANALSRLLSLPNLDEKSRSAILNELSWGVPRVVMAQVQ